MWVYDVSTLAFLAVNEAAIRHYGYARDEFLAMTIEDIRPVGELARLRASIANAPDGLEASGNWTHRRKDGELIDVEISSHPIDVDGRAARLVISYDVTARNRAMRALQDSEDRFRDLVEHSHDLMCTHDLDGRILSVNPWAAERLGYQLADLVGRDIRDVVARDFRDRFDDYLARVVRDGVAEGTITVDTPRGERLALEYRNTLRTEGVPTPVVRGFAHDVTSRYREARASERHLAELEDARSALTALNAALRRAVAERELLTAAIEQSGETVLITDADGTVEYVNSAFTMASGYSREEIVGQTPRLLKSGVQDPAVYEHLWDTIASGRTWRGRLVNRHKDGHLYTEDAAISPVRDAAGRIRHYVGVKRDITEQLELEAQFLQVQKMEGIGRLAGGVAHDFNNLLTVINGTVGLALHQVRDDDPIREDFVQIAAAAERAAALTRQLLAFSRKQTLTPEVLDIGALISRFSHMLRRLIGEHITLLVHAPHGAVKAIADRGQLEQVLLNLAVNARDAMPDGGTLTIEIEAVHVMAGDAPAGQPIPPGAYAQLVVADTGTGMDAATAARVFEPFFTTKPHGSGTGLGLSTVYGIVKQSGGFIRVDSESGAGSRFTILLPRADAAPATVPVAVPSTSRRATETVLVVEDEPGVRRIASRMLESAGHRVLTAACGAEALVLVDLHEGPLDLVVTDLVMAGISGNELAARLKVLRPGLKVVFMSGHADAATSREWRAANASRILTKPFTADGLAGFVRRSLDA